MKLPKEIKVTVMWDTYYMSVSAYSIYHEELVEICDFCSVTQLNLFTIVDEEAMIDWIDNIYHRTPAAIFIDQIIY